MTLDELLKKLDIDPESEDAAITVYGHSGIETNLKEFPVKDFEIERIVVNLEKLIGVEIIIYL